MRKISLFLGLLTSIISVFGYSSTDISNATFLAEQGIITTQTSAKGYRLDDKITRAEVIGIALKIKGTTLPDNYFCKNYFTDASYVPGNNWVCRAVELAADDGIISRANTKARPKDFITRAEALAIIMNSLNECNRPVGRLTFFADVHNWQEPLLNDAAYCYPEVLENLHHSITPGCGMQPCDEYYFRPDNSATRGEVFSFGLNILNGQKNSFNNFVWKIDELISMEYPGTISDRVTLNVGKEVKFGNHGEYAVGVFRDYNFAQNALNYGLYNSLSVVKIGNYKGLKIDNSGESSRVDIIVPLDDKMIIVSSAEDPYEIAKKILPPHLGNQINSFNPKVILRVYYTFLLPEFKILGGSVGNAYIMRSPAGVPLETFQAWYKNVTDVTFREDTLKDLGDNTYEFLVDMTENGVKSTYKVKSKVDLENFKINNLSSVKQ